MYVVFECVLRDSGTAYRDAMQSTERCYPLSCKLIKFHESWIKGVSPCLDDFETPIPTVRTSRTIEIASGKSPTVGSAATDFGLQTSRPNSTQFDWLFFRLQNCHTLCNNFLHNRITNITFSRAFAGSSIDPDLVFFASPRRRGIGTFCKVIFISLSN